MSNPELIDLLKEVKTALDLSPGKQQQLDELSTEIEAVDQEKNAAAKKREQAKRKLDHYDEIKPDLDFIGSAMKTIAIDAGSLAEGTQAIGEIAEQFQSSTKALAKSINKSFTAIQAAAAAVGALESTITSSNNKSKDSKDLFKREAEMEHISREVKNYALEATRIAIESPSFIMDEQAKVMETAAGNVASASEAFSEIQADAQARALSAYTELSNSEIALKEATAAYKSLVNQKTNISALVLNFNKRI